MEHILSVRELSNDDIGLIADYWLGADKDFLLGMGALIEKIPSREEWNQMLSTQLSQDYPGKQSYATIWLIDGIPSGHCNINKIKYGEEAYMHLHLWKNPTRQKGLGQQLVKLSLPYFFNNYHLKNLYCEPYALNPAPNKTLKNIGFELVKQFITTPGFLNFEQEVNLWKLSLEKYKSLQ